MPRGRPMPLEREHALHELPRDKTGSEGGGSLEPSATPSDPMYSTRAWATDLARRRVHAQDSFHIQFTDSGGGPGLAVFQGSAYAGGRGLGDPDAGGDVDITVPFLSDTLLSWNEDMVCSLPQVCALRCAVNAMRWTVYAMRCVLCGVRCALCAVRCALRADGCTSHALRCAVCAVLCAVQCI